MDPHSLVYFAYTSALTSLIVLVCLFYSIKITTQITKPNSREFALRRLRVALFGGIFFTSSPFMMLMFWLPGGLRWPTHTSELFAALVTSLGVRRLVLFSWLPDFFIGYAIFALAWSIVNRHTKSSSSGAGQVGI
jgi:hypothetical protein